MDWTWRCWRDGLRRAAAEGYRNKREKYFANAPAKTFAHRDTC